MPVPKKRTSKNSKRLRRSHLALRKQALSTCPNCKAAKPSHCVCPTCGMYKGQRVADAV